MDKEKIERLKDEITCAICCEYYTEPRILPCMHYYCKNCIEIMLNKSEGDDNLQQCPECREPIKLKASDVQFLKPAFFVHRLQEVHNSFKHEACVDRASQIECGMCDPKSDSPMGKAVSICWTCKRFVCRFCVGVHSSVKDYKGHDLTSLSSELSAGQIPNGNVTTPTRCTKHSEQCRVYCIPCQELICTTCALISHKGHECDDTDETCVAKCKETIRCSIEPVKREHSRISSALQHFEERRIQIAANTSHLRNVIDKEFDQFSEEVDKCRKAALQQVYQFEAQKLKTLDPIQHDFKYATSEMGDLIQFTDELLEVANPDQFLSQQKQLMKRISSVVDVSQYNLEPPVDLNISMNMDESLLHKVANYCHVRLSDPDQSKCRAFGTGVERVITGRKTEFQLQLVYADGHSCTEQQDIGVNIETLDATAKHPTCNPVPNIAYTEQGHYIVSYTPTARGKHKITICVNQKEINGSPFEVVAYPHPEDLRSPKRIIQNDLSEIDGLTINNDDQLVMSEKMKSEVSVRDKNGMKMKCIKIEELLRIQPTRCRPTGVAVDQKGFMYVADNMSHSLLKLSPDGAQILASIQKRGTIEGQLRSPGGVRISNNGEVFICDCRNHRIQVFDENLNFLRTFGKLGNSDGEFNWPVDMVFDSHRNIYVSDMDNHRIQVFNKEEKFVHSFGVKGSEPGCLNRPVFMFLDPNGYLYVSENENHRVSVFQSSGKFICILGGEGVAIDKTMSPKGITMDANGFLYVGERGNKRIRVF